MSTPQPTPETDAEFPSLRHCPDETAVWVSIGRLRDLERQRDEVRSERDLARERGFEMADVLERTERQRDEAREEIAAAKAILRQVDLPDEPLVVQAKRMVDQHDWQIGIARGQARQIEQANETLRTMREAINEAHEAISKLQENGHSDGCKWLNFANAKCDCGIDSGDNTLAKLKPFLP